MSRFLYLALLIGLMTAITACDQYSRHRIGTATGTASVAGMEESDGVTLLGGPLEGVMGVIVGERMENTDRARLKDALETSPSYETISWSNPDTGSRFTVIPEPAYEDPQTKLACRNIRIMAEVDNRTERTDAVGCRQNGRWVLQ